ncbi:Cupredoxin [Cadophora sp. MPI-SDFR-AT-0126]|nr:Cupredoxin [Leotiomycetes sp. MPI-SDFR-AT-0126]
MYFSTTLFAFAAAVSTAIAQEGTTIQVTVGKGGLVYSPNNIRAEVGTNIEFSFFPKNHTVTQSSFKDPCHPLENGFFSSFVPTANSPSGSTFTITVKDTKPIWLYCGQGNHCQTGMVAAINAPQTGNTFEAFALLAKNATASTSPPGGAVGGILKLADGSESSSSGSGALFSTISSTRTVQTTVTATVTAVVTQDESTYTTTYPSTYGTTYTTALPQTTVAISVVSSSTSASASPSSTGNSAAGLAVNGGMAGAVLLAGLAML